MLYGQRQNYGSLSLLSIVFMTRFLNETLHYRFKCIWKYIFKENNLNGYWPYELITDYQKRPNKVLPSEDLPKCYLRLSSEHQSNCYSNTTQYVIQRWPIVST